jgi:hypothetical protein
MLGEELRRVRGEISKIVGRNNSKKSKENNSFRE